MQNHKFYFTLLFSIVLLSCTKKVVTTPPTTPKIPEVVEAPKTTKIVIDESRDYELFGISRTGCYGNCPSYELKVYSNGNATFKGNRNVENVGNFEAHFSKADIQIVIDLAKKLNYFGFQDAYPLDRKNAIPDLPYTYTFLNDGKNTKRITNNYDCPVELINFEQTLDKLIKQQVWKVANY